MKRFLEHNFPPGYVYKTEMFAVAGVFFWVVLSSLVGFFGEYARERDALYIRRGTDVILDETKSMPDFIYILGDKLFSFFIFAGLIFVCASVVHYMYHHRGSKSVYTMRRLPNRFEQHRRCLFFPLAFALVFVLVGVILFFVYYAVYMNCTPQVCLTPDQWQKIWRVFR